MNISDKFSSHVRTLIKKAIEEVGGNEVLFIGHIDESGRVIEAEAVARGNDWSVPALSPYLNKSDVIIHNHPSGNLTPSSADMVVASTFGNHGIGFFIVDNLVKRVYVVAEPIVLKEKKQLDSFELTLLVKEKLPLIIEGFEERDAQFEMLQSVCDSFNEERIDIIEAGTGVGKSLAYLVPAFDWALKNDERVVISTATINLQQQVYEKDIKIVEKLFGENPGSFLIKGRGNYLCKRRLYETLEEVSLFEEESEELKAIAEWSETTDTGDRSDLSFYPSENVWSRVRSEGDICLGLRCRYHGECFVFRARRRAAKAKILVVNHHLLFSDLSMRVEGAGFEEPAILPSFNRVIFDEAHSIEKSASSFFSQRFSSFTIKKYLQRIIMKKKGKNRGIYYYLLSALNLDVGEMEKIPSLSDEIIEQALKLDILTGDSMGEERGYLFEELISEGESKNGNEILSSIKQLRTTILRYLEEWKSFFERIEEIGIEGISEERIYECKMFLSRLERVGEICSSFLEYRKKRESVFWVERNTQTNSVYFVITPIEISGIMDEALYKKMKSVIFTSATLTVGGNFDFWKKRVGLMGLSSRKINQLLLDSPFNYEKNVLLCIARDIPSPEEDGYVNAVADFISSSLKITKGHALVLFTSYRMLNDTYRFVKSRNINVNLLIQGEEERAKLLDRFKRDSASVLFATDSFWEGVDAPGKALELLIITRLPFRVPTEPVMKARLKIIKERGGNPFMELSLPEAIIKLRQGFGRLIRNQQDRGVVVILDSRVVTKRYGKLFLDSLPPAHREIEIGKKIIEKIYSFFNS